MTCGVALARLLAGIDVPMDLFLHALRYIDEPGERPAWGGWGRSGLGDRAGDWRPHGRAVEGKSRRESCVWRRGVAVGRRHSGAGGVPAGAGLSLPCERACRL